MADNQDQVQYVRTFMHHLAQTIEHQLRIIFSVEAPITLDTLSYNTFSSFPKSLFGEIYSSTLRSGELYDTGLIVIEKQFSLQLRTMSEEQHLAISLLNIILDSLNLQSSKTIPKCFDHSPPKEGLPEWTLRESAQKYYIAIFKLGSHNRTHSCIGLAIPTAMLSQPMCSSTLVTSAEDAEATQKVELVLEICRLTLPLRQLGNLEVGSILELNCGINDPVSITLNKKRLQKATVILHKGQIVLKLL